MYGLRTTSYVVERGVVIVASIRKVRFLTEVAASSQNVQRQERPGTPASWRITCLAWLGCTWAASSQHSLVSVTKSRIKSKTRDFSLSCTPYLILCSALVPGILQRQTGKGEKTQDQVVVGQCRVRQAWAKRRVRMQVLE